MDYHGVGCTVYTKKYASLANKFDDSVGHAEEKQFTDSFTNEAVQLDPKHTIIHTVHNFNADTIRKRILFGGI